MKRPSAPVIVLLLTLHTVLLPALLPAPVRGQAPVPALPAPLSPAPAVIPVAVIPVDEEPRHRFVFADSTLRVLEVAIVAGDTTLAHRHDNDLATINVENGRTRTRNVGADWGAPRVRALGEVTFNEYSGTPVAHTVQSIDAIGYRLVGVENLRPGSWTTGPPIAAAATKMLGESRAFRAYEVRLDAATGETQHVHDVPVFIALMSGSVVVSGSDAGPGKPLAGRGQWIVIPGRQPHTVVRGSGEAQVIEIEVR